MPGNGSIAHVPRNVKSWNDGQIAPPWISDALSDKRGRFRKLCGDRDMKTPFAALKAKSANVNPAERKARAATNEERSSGHIQPASAHLPVTSVAPSA